MAHQAEVIPGHRELEYATRPPGSAVWICLIELQSLELVKNTSPSIEGAAKTARCVTLAHHAEVIPGHRKLEYATRSPGSAVWIYPIELHSLEHAQKQSPPIERAGQTGRCVTLVHHAEVVPGHGEQEYASSSPGSAVWIYPNDLQSLELAQKQSPPIGGAGVNGPLCHHGASSRSHPWS